MTGGVPQVFIGSNNPAWLWTAPFPAMVSYRRLTRRRASLRPVTTPFAIDSGAFSELDLNGAWAVSPEQYAYDILRYQRELGNPEFVGQQDLMVEPSMLARTGGSVRSHQAATIANYLRLEELAPTVRWLPTLHGHTADDYLDHLAQWQDAGLDLTQYERVGVGSICRESHTPRVASIVTALAEAGLRQHTYGVKITGLRAFGDLIVSTDTASWSYAAMFRPPLSGCRHQRCGSCMRWAAQWRQDLLTTLATDATPGHPAAP